MEAFGALLWGTAGLVLVLSVALAGGILRGRVAGDGVAWWARLYLVVSWATFPAAVPLILLALLPVDPRLPPALVILGLVRGMAGVLLVPLGALLLLLVIAAAARDAAEPGDGGGRARAAWLALATAANALPLLLVLLKR